MKYIKLILLVFSLLLLPWAGNEAWAKDAEITDLRWTARNDGDPPFVRIVTDLTKAVQAEAAIDKSGKNFEVILKNTQKSFSGSQYDMDPRAIDFTTVSEKDGDTYIDVALTKPQKIDDIHVFALRPDAKLGKPHRLVIDIPIQGAIQRSTGSIEVAQSHIRETVGIRKIAHHMLYDELCASIDIGRIMWEIFFNRRFFGFAVYRGRGREYDLGDAYFLHAKKQVERPFDVICIIHGRIHHGFSDK